MRLHESRIRVRYAETDQMGVVYHSNYLVWMEVGRIDYCRAIGINYRDMEKDDGIFLAVVEAKCRYHYPARYDDEVIVRTWVADANPRTLHFAYEMRDESGRKLAAGETRHVYVDRTMKPVRLPARFHDAFGVKTHQPA